MPVPIPRITTAAHIEKVLKRLPIWRGATRVRVLTSCSQTIENLLFKKAISAAEARDLRAKVQTKLSEAKWQQRAGESKAQTRVIPSSTMRG